MSEYSRMKRFVLLEIIEKLEQQGEIERRGLKKTELVQGGDLKKAELILKSLNVTGAGMLKEGMAVPFVFDRYPGLKEQFEKGVTAESLLLMIDLSPFSSMVADWDPVRISLFLERYYRVVATRVTEVGGVVEKYIGDAVIALFGAPFESSTESKHVKAVIELARALVGEVEDEFNGEVTAKCAIALGKCHYGYLGPSEHTELTIVGTPLTELFRLESDCPKRSIIMLRSLFDTVRDGFTILPADEFPFLKWKYSTEELSLRGVGKKEVAILTLDGD